MGPNRVLAGVQLVAGGAVPRIPLSCMAPQIASSGPGGPADSLGCLSAVEAHRSVAFNSETDGTSDDSLSNFEKGFNT